MVCIKFGEKNNIRSKDMSSVLIIFAIAIFVIIPISNAAELEITLRSLVCFKKKSVYI